MSVESVMGLDHDLVVRLVDSWPAWTKLQPALAEVPEPALLRDWLRGAPAPVADRVLYGLAWLASIEGGQDPLAGQVLMWAFLPAATHLAARLRTLTEDIDELIASELWVCVRTFPLSRRKVAANLVRDLRTRVLREHDTIRGTDATTRVTTLVPWLGSEAGEPLPPWEPSAWDDLVDVLDDACERGTITPKLRQLLLTLVDAAHTFPCRSRSGLGLLGNDTTREAARRLGLSERTVKRHARLALDALIGSGAEPRVTV